MTERKRRKKPCEVLQHFFAKLNESMKLLRSLKCSTRFQLMFPEKLLYSSSKAH